MLTVVHPRTTKLVVVNEGVMGARGMVEGGILLDTILQPPASDNSSLVTLEIPVVQVNIQCIRVCACSVCWSMRICAEVCPRRVCGRAVLHICFCVCRA